MQKMFVVEAPFVEELSGIAIVKILDMKEQAMNMIKLKFIRNKAVFKVTNNTHETVTFGQTEMIGSCRLEIIRLLQNKARGTPRTFSQTLPFQCSKWFLNNRIFNLLERDKLLLTAVSFLKSEENVFPANFDTP